jgi:hypothetical protein
MLLLFPFCISCLLLLLFSFLVYSSTLWMEAVYSSETSGFLLTSPCYKPEDSTLHYHQRENLKFERYEVIIYNKLFMRISILLMLKELCFVVLLQSALYLNLYTIACGLTEHLS